MSKVIIKSLVLVMLLALVVPFGLGDSGVAHAAITGKERQVLVELNESTYIANGRFLSFAGNRGNLTPIERNGSTYIPAAAVTLALGGSVQWDAKAKLSIFTIDGRFVKTTPGSKRLWTSNGEVILPHSTFTMNDTLMVPLMAFTKAFNAKVVQHKMMDSMVFAIYNKAGADNLWFAKDTTYSQDRNTKVHVDVTGFRTRFPASWGTPAVVYDPSGQIVNGGPDHRYRTMMYIGDRITVTNYVLEYHQASPLDFMFDSEQNFLSNELWNENRWTDSSQTYIDGADEAWIYMETIQTNGIQNIYVYNVAFLGSLAHVVELYIEGVEYVPDYSMDYYAAEYALNYIIENGVFTISNP
ncbi:stalk domain-containing protein [Paenibacillus daejeonensis]|uniref:stalk domain-containing protein n=1 Tax=Paenibacillus daejeonensis TaxID=135193 RepID=UPI00037CC568|nr:stalk domain-containing protein [Paenibacillus daejeonensis]